MVLLAEPGLTPHPRHRLLPKGILRRLQMDTSDRADGIVRGLFCVGLDGSARQALWAGACSPASSP